MNNYKKIHFIGIGGIGVSSLARYYASSGVSISGSDPSPDKSLTDLKNTKIFKKHLSSNISKNTDLVVYSNAISQKNPELFAAKKMGIKILSYPQALGEIVKKYFTIAISGTHGKSTTTAMIAAVLINAGLDPTVIIGTKIKSFNNTNFRKGESKYLVIEADEYKAALLNYYPKIAIINNIEADHLDFYKNTDDIVDTFAKYINDNVKENTLILNKNDKNIKKLVKKIKAKPCYFSVKDDLAKKIKLPLPGEHNIQNALACLSVAKKLKIDKKIALESLKNFEGAWRRFEEKKMTLKNGQKVTLINDYAHHPTALKATLKGVKEKYKKEKIFAVFQPHQYERTYRLFNEFKKTITTTNIKKLIVSDIYSVKGRESTEIIKKINSEMLTDGAKNAQYIGKTKDIANYLLKNLQDNDILIIMGAGNIYQLLEKKLIKK